LRIKPSQADRNDGMRLTDALITAAVRCAPPGNKPSTGRARRMPCRISKRSSPRCTVMRVIVTLGKLADDTVHGIVKTTGAYRTPRATFKHGAETQIALPASPAATILASYHPSRQNTNTGVLTEPMLDAIFARANVLLQRSDP
jgi:uracil-DNA glycosylase